MTSQLWFCCSDQVPASVTQARTPSTITSKLPKAPDCGIESSDKIFGGETTRIDEYPWLVQIQYTKREFKCTTKINKNSKNIFILAGNKTGFHCGGSLINQRYVITAAHCILKNLPLWQPKSVRLGEWDTSTVRDCDDSYFDEVICNNPPVDISIEEIIVHENYEPKSRNQHNDIALLRLSNDVQYTNFIKPICLPVEASVRNNNLTGIKLDVAGWGLIKKIKAFI